jgi:hypothetical protein
MKKIIMCLCVGAIVMLSFIPCWPFSVIVRWSPNTESDLAGYKVYHGTESRLYDTSVDAGMVTSQEIGGLIEGVTYYFAVTAYNAGGVESYFSEEVSFLEPEADYEGGGGTGDGGVPPTGGGGSGGGGGTPPTGGGGSGGGGGTPPAGGGGSGAGTSSGSGGGNGGGCFIGVLLDSWH